MNCGETIVSVVGMAMPAVFALGGVYFGYRLEKLKARKDAIVSVYRKLLELKFSLLGSDKKEELLVELITLHAGSKSEARQKLCKEISEMLWATERFPKISELLPIIENISRDGITIGEVRQSRKELSDIIEVIEKKINKKYVMAATKIAKDKRSLQEKIAEEWD